MSNNKRLKADIEGRSSFYVPEWHLQSVINTTSNGEMETPTSSVCSSTDHQPRHDYENASSV